MKRLMIILLATAAAISASTDKGNARLAAVKEEARSVQLARFEDGNYAMFIHFGLYSHLEGVWKDKTYFGNAEWIMNGNQAGIPVDEYVALAKDFNPADFDADAIAQLAKDAGMKYIIITSKHHEGFAMFDSDADDFNIHDATPLKRDLMKELADACHKHGLGIGFYYSQFQDWTAPGGGGGPRCDASGKEVTFEEYFRNKVIPQVTELLTNYGEIQLIWFDTPGNMQAHYSAELVDLVHKLQPGALVSSRVGNNMGDYQTLGDMEVPLQNIDGLWEGIDVTQVGWGYSRNDAEWKSPDFIVRELASTIARGGTFMMNVGPDKTGAVAPQAAESLRRAGEWVNRYPKAVYAAGPSPWGHALPWGDAVTNDGNIYLLVYEWPEDGILRVPGMNCDVKKARIYGGKKLKHTKDGNWLCINVPARRPDSIVSVIELTPGEGGIDKTIAVDPSVTSEFSVVFSQHDLCTSRKDAWMDKFGEWKFKNQICDLGADSWFEWTADFEKDGYYDVELECKGDGQVLWQLEIDGEPSLLDRQVTSNRYGWQRLGWIKVGEAGKHSIRVRMKEGNFEGTAVSGIRFTRINLD